MGGVGGWGEVPISLLLRPATARMARGLQRRHGGAEETGRGAACAPLPQCRQSQPGRRMPSCCPSCIVVVPKHWEVARLLIRWDAIHACGVSSAASADSGRKREGPGGKQRGAGLLPDV